MNNPSIFKRLGRRLKESWPQPFVSQWPLMLAYIVLVGWVSVTRNPVPRWMLIFLHAYLAAALVCVTRSRLVKWGVYVVIYVLFLTELTLDWLFNMHISPTVLMLMAETNGRETTEFFVSLADKPDFWPMVGCSVSMLVLNVLAEAMRQRVNSLLTGKVRTLRVLRWIAVLLLAGGIVSSSCYVSLFRCQEMNEVDEWCSHMRHPEDAVSRLVVASFDIYLSGKEMERANEQAEQIQVVAQQGDADTVNVVLVIGESYIREHAAIYGYRLPTTPFLSREKQAGRLFVFSDVVSPYNQTTKVLRNLLSCNSLGDGEHWASAPPLTAVFKKNGFRVAMHDNQRASCIADVFAFSLNTFLYHPRMMAACYDEVDDFTSDYDGDFIGHYASIDSIDSIVSIDSIASIADAGGDSARQRQLVIFHLMGQHVSFDCRYPDNDPRFAHFTADDYSFRQEPWLTSDMRSDIAHYDNATRYNDDVIRMITELYKEQSTVVVYLSDHGEEVYDYRPSYGRDDWELGDNARLSLQYQYCVPFMVWCSDLYRERHPETMEQLEKAVERPLMLDNTCHLLFSLAGLKTPYYHNTRDVLSDSYHCPPRLVNDKDNYDSIVAQ